MMTGLLFKGIRKDTCEIIYGDSCRCDNDKEKLICYIHTEGIWIEVDSNTVQQYTGFDDINNRKIFGGDIIERAHSVTEPKRRMTVRWWKGSWMVWDGKESEDLLYNWCKQHILNGKNIGGCVVTGSTLASSSDGVF